MARTVKEYDERYAEFLDVAQTLFFSQGYEQTTVRQIIDAVGVAKGTFYHYFGSKIDILEALVERITAQMTRVLAEIVADETLGAVEKLERFFTHAQQWKVARKEFLLDTARALYREENVLLRVRLRDEGIAAYVPLLAEIIRQGISEGVFHVASPDEMAGLVLMMPQNVSLSVTALLLSDDWDADDVAKVRRQITVFNTGVARVLGMPDDSLNLFDGADLDAWLEAEREQA
jgi:AcrR family transcriptional regulator